MTASFLKTAGTLALFAALGIGEAQAQQNGATRQIVVEPAQATVAQGSTEAAGTQDAASVQASPAPEATAQAPVTEPQAAEATAAVPVRADPAPIAKPVVKAVVKEPRPAVRHAGYGQGRGYSPISQGRRNCH
jgi:hypothetical protein